MDFMLNLSFQLSNGLANEVYMVRYIDDIMDLFSKYIEVPDLS